MGVLTELCLYINIIFSKYEPRKMQFRLFLFFFRGVLLSTYTDMINFLRFQISKKEEAEMWTLPSLGTLEWKVGAYGGYIFILFQTK